MWRILRNIAEGDARALGDASTFEDPRGGEAVAGCPTGSHRLDSDDLLMQALSVECHGT